LFFHSYAKLNLYLEVLDKRKDRYHNIKSLFERIDLCDKIILKSYPPKKIKVVCNAPGIPKDSSKNLAYRSARLLQRSLNVDKGAYIKIIKRIPPAAGLGGGSSNAAAVLIGLNKLWRLNLSQKRLLAFAKEMGCDVPFFIYNTSFAKARGRGDIIKPLKALNKIKLWHILAVPQNKVSTARIYKEWDRLRIKLTKPKYNVRILNLALRKKDLVLLGEVLFNSLEQVSAKLYPRIGCMRLELMRLGLKSILMSGSGPAVFGIVSSKKEAVSLSRQLKAGLGKENNSCQIFVTRTR
jgi:4-diphosphocytidyl-2-C-methyl-D-erythritol kinase